MSIPQESSPNGLGCLCRFYWMLFGNALLFFLLVFIFVKRLPWPSVLDAAAAVVLASLVVVRYVDIRFLHGQTGEGSPATLADWRRYVLLLVPLGVAGWGLARAAARFL